MFIFIEQFIFIFNMVYFHSTTYICVQQHVFLFNVNPWYCHSTEIFIQLLRKLFSFNRNIHSNTTQTFFYSKQIFIQLQHKPFSFNRIVHSSWMQALFSAAKNTHTKITFCKFPDIPNNIHSTTTKMIQQTCPVPLPTLHKTFPHWEGLEPNKYGGHRRVENSI